VISLLGFGLTKHLLRSKIRDVEARANKRLDGKDQRIDTIISEVAKTNREITALSNSLKAVKKGVWGAVGEDRVRFGEMDVMDSLGWRWRWCSFTYAFHSTLFEWWQKQNCIPLAGTWWLNSLILNLWVGPNPHHHFVFVGFHPIYAHSMGPLRRGGGLQRAITLNTSASFRTLPLNLTDVRRMSFFESQIRGNSGKAQDFATYQLISSLNAGYPSSRDSVNVTMDCLASLSSSPSFVLLQISWQSCPIPLRTGKDTANSL